MLRRTMWVVLKAAVVVLLLSSGPALADRERGNHGRGGRERAAARWVPEFDPATAGAIAAIVAGGGVLLARKRRR